MAIKSLSDIQKQLAEQAAMQGNLDQQAITDAQGRATRANQFASQPMAGMPIPWVNPGQGAQTALANARNAATQNQAAIAAGDPTRSPGAAMDRIIGIGEDTYQNAANNQTDQMLLNVLNSRISGNDQPYNTETINAFKTGAANQGVAAEMANNQQAQASLESRGFTPADPAYQAAMMRNQQQRQMGNQAANLSIAQNANTANYDARGQAMSQANTVNRGAQAAQQNAAQLLQSNLNQVSSQDQARAPTWKPPTYSAFTAGQAKFK